MQPYFFPYVGYWQLIKSSDLFVVYDDVAYIKNGWINRNYILANNKKLLVTIPLSGASPNKLINQILIQLIFFGVSTAIDWLYKCKYFLHK